MVSGWGFLLCSHSEADAVQFEDIDPTNKRLDELVTATQAAIRLRIPSDTVRGWAKRGQLTAVDLDGARRRYVLSDVIECAFDRGVF